VAPGLGGHQGWAPHPHSSSLHDSFHLLKVRLFFTGSSSTPGREAQARSPPLLSSLNVKASKSSFPNLGEVLQWFSPSFSSIGSFFTTLPWLQGPICNFRGPMCNI
jgi:hypothetical protein